MDIIESLRKKKKYPEKPPIKVKLVPALDVVKEQYAKILDKDPETWSEKDKEIIRLWTKHN